MEITEPRQGRHGSHADVEGKRKVLSRVSPHIRPVEKMTRHQLRAQSYSYRQELSRPSPIRYHVPVETLTAFVLAGGRSSRMGSDKALLRLGQRTLLERALHTLSAVAANPVIVGARARYGAYGVVIEDIYPDCGPLGGIHAALSATATDLNLLLSVDMPQMQPEFLAWLLQRSAASEHWIVVPELDGRPQPLCAVYRRDVRGPAEQALANRDLKVSNLFTKVPTQRIAEHEMMAAGFSPEIFTNVNTPGEFERLAAEFPAEHPRVIVHE